jgi:hypothetical protein
MSTTGGEKRRQKEAEGLKVVPPSHFFSLAERESAYKPLKDMREDIH